MEHTNTEVVAIAKKQKAIIWLILVSPLVFALPLAWIVIAIVQIVIAIVQVVFVYQLTQALKLSAP
jgi:hypothetical protein